MIIDTILTNSSQSNEGALSPDDIQLKMEEAKLNYEKKLEIFDKLKWVMIVGEWNNVNDTEKQFNKFDKDKGLIKLRFHYETFVNEHSKRYLLLILKNRTIENFHIKLLKFIFMMGNIMMVELKHLESKMDHLTF